MVRLRLEDQQLFAENHGWGSADLYPLAADASHRSYIRLLNGTETCLLMDAPPETEKLKEFVTIAKHLQAIGLRTPEIYAYDFAQGFALVEDFGDNTFTRLLEAGANELALYRQAADVLIHLHRQGENTLNVAVPPYDIELMLEEVGRFLKWFVPAARGTEATSDEVTTYFDVWRNALHNLSEERSAFVFRDFHVDNLMVVEDGGGVKACGLLDFQDALIGSPAYDMVSLLEDARRDISAETYKEVLVHYYAGCPSVDSEKFERDMAILGAQRHAKVAGLFVRLSREAGKHTYLRHLPRVQTLLAKSLSHSKLVEVSEIIEAIVPGYRTVKILVDE